MLPFKYWAWILKFLLASQLVPIRYIGWSLFMLAVFFAHLLRRCLRVGRVRDTAAVSLIGLAAWAGSNCVAAEPHADSSVTNVESLSLAIDRAIALPLESAGIPLAESIDDAHYIRRVTLDLAGRVPTRHEQNQFLQDTSVDKRERLVDRLLDSPDSAFHERNELDLLWLARLQWNSSWRSYLLEAMRERRPLDRIVAELLLPDRLRPDDKGAAAFLKQRVNDLDIVTNDTSSLLFGVNVACAKCHDHPLVPDWHQDHYYGMASFFKRTFGTRRGSVAERFEGEVKFTTTKGVEKKSSFMFLDGRIVEETKVSGRSEEEWKSIRDQLKKSEQDDKVAPPPLPDFSPRQALVDLAMDGGPDSLLARNLANRLWARLMGRGLVHPLDQMHSGNPPSHPELLERLARELVFSGYDPRPVLKSIVLSDAYARSARWTHSVPAPSPESFAYFLPRPLTPNQYALSLWIASRNPEKLPASTTDAAWPARRQEWEHRVEGTARQFEIPSELFQVSIEEALLLSNNAQSENDYLADNAETLVGAITHMAPQTPDQIQPVQQPTVDTALNENPESACSACALQREQIQCMYESILTRRASDDELQVVLGYLDSRQQRPEAAWKQMVWALLTSAEFRFNY